ncbi:MAG TPA: hypothetical protein VK589_06125 [Chryseolinea sp.]|nr:hypothetical protein [Chryseolinea sp.]
MKLSYKQLAFVLDIKSIRALEHILAAHCKATGQEPPAPAETTNEYLFNFNDKGEKTTRTTWPDAVEVAELEKHLGISLQSAIDDIRENYLNRSATKKWILCDFPQNKIKLAAEQGKKNCTLQIPPALKSLISPAVAAQIGQEWKKRFPKAVVKV